jgi:hypothetical protein
MRETVKNNCQLLEEGEFSLPKGWEVKKLGEVGNIFNGTKRKTMQALRLLAQVVQS